MESALDSLMSQDIQQPHAVTNAEEQRGRDDQHGDNQLQRNRQWEADATQLLRPAAFYVWPRPDWPKPS